MKLKKLCCFLLVLLMVLPLAACSAKEAPKTETQTETTAATDGKDTANTTTPADTAVKSSRDTLIVALPSDPANFDPNDNSIQMVHAFKRNIYETLVQRDSNGELQPMLAESWEYPDDETILFHIRKGVKFHNGDELKASDVLFSLKRCADVPAASVAVAKVDWDRTEVVDEYTLKLVTKGPYVPQLAYLEWPLTGIFCQRAYEEAGGDFYKAPIGTGAYKVKDYIAGDNYTIVANEDYWDPDLPRVKTVIFRVISEASNRTIELETGGVDIVYEIPAADVTRVEDNPELSMYRDASMNTNFLFFRCDHAPFDNILLRQAVAYALDVPSAVKTAYKGTGIPATGYCSPGVEGFDASITPYERNIDKAKELMAEAGYPDGFTCKLYTDTTQERMDLGEVFQNQLRQIGIDCELITMEPVSYQEMFYRGEHDMMLYGLTTTTAECDKAFGWFTSTHALGQAFVGWHTEEYDNLMAEAAATLDKDARMKLYSKVQQIIKDECIIIPTLHREILSATRADIAGFENNLTFESPLVKDCYAK